MLQGCMGKLRGGGGWGQVGGVGLVVDAGGTSWVVKGGNECTFKHPRVVGGGLDQCRDHALYVLHPTTPLLVRGLFLLLFHPLPHPYLGISVLPTGRGGLLTLENFKKFIIIILGIVRQVDERNEYDADNVMKKVGIETKQWGTGKCWWNQQRSIVPLSGANRDI